MEQKEIGLFEAMYSARAIRRFRTDPIPDSLILQVIEAGTMAPSGTNSQPWAFVVVRDPETKRFVQERYAATFREYAGASDLSSVAASGDRSRLATSATYLAEHLHEVPVMLFCCVERRAGKPRYDSIFPAVQNILLACRGLGLGACLTTLHTAHESEINARLGIPDTHSSAALIPIGFPADRHGAIRRRPAAEVTYFERFGVTRS